MNTTARSGRPQPSGPPWCLILNWSGAGSSQAWKVTAATRVEELIPRGNDRASKINFSPGFRGRGDYTHNLFKLSGGRSERSIKCITKLSYWFIFNGTKNCRSFLNTFSLLALMLYQV